MTTLFNSTQRQRLTEHLEQMTQHILRACRQHQNGLYWLSPYYTSETTYDFKVTTDLFQGNSGIALFFLARYSYSGSQADLHIAQRTMDFVSDHLEQNNPQAFGLFTGLSGVIYTYIRLFELGGGQQYLDCAHALALSYQEQLVRQTIKADLLSGYSGSLFVLTLLQHYRPEPALIKLIQELIDRLVSEARPSEKGLKWDYNQSKSAYDSLTGFSHGASGIAYILLEVAQYFNNKALLYLAEEALLYEMQYFHADFDNWLDLRLGSHRLQTANIQHWELKTFCLISRSSIPGHMVPQGSAWPGSQPGGQRVKQYTWINAATSPKSAAVLSFRLNGRTIPSAVDMPGYCLYANLSPYGTGIQW
ncbi:hypothetical protein KUH03_31155 [Sphingobacterium sp. E70]|nr:lanthionine synthetase LanC family protein [Sphingobacterium sp. E70]ULT23595.1 hypothetical protein KUH03_31155 [Sphingobacterium sp. E70]